MPSQVIYLEDIDVALAVIDGHIDGFCQAAESGDFEKAAAIRDSLATFPFPRRAPKRFIAKLIDRACNGMDHDIDAFAAAADSTGGVHA